MEKTKKLIMIMVKFLVVMFCICLIIVLALTAFTHKDFSFNRIMGDLASAFLYLIGYGDAPNFNILVQHILSVIGVMALKLVVCLFNHQTLLENRCDDKQTYCLVEERQVWALCFCIDP